MEMPILQRNRKASEAMTDKVKLDHDWLEQAIESSGRTFMEVKKCPKCKGTGVRKTRSRSINERIIEVDCPDCKEGWVIK